MAPRKLTLHFADKCRFFGYSGPKAAIQHCIDSGLGSCQAAFQLESTHKSVIKYANIYGLSLTDNRGKRDNIGGVSR